MKKSLIKQLEIFFEGYNVLFVFKEHLKNYNELSKLRQLFYCLKFCTTRKLIDPLVVKQLAKE